MVVALKTRSLPADEAVAQSLAALAWLRAQGAEQIYFKYCSTFDSTPQGNIGPVTDALMARLGTDFTIATPAFPDNKRTVFRAICSWATCCSTNRACSIIRSRP